MGSDGLVPEKMPKLCLTNKKQGKTTKFTPLTVAGRNMFVIIRRVA
jgi:hypothetical protein